MTGFLHKHRNLLIYIGTVLFSVLFLLVGNKLAGYQPSNTGGDALTCTAVVTSIEDVQSQTYTLSGDAGEVYTKSIYFRAKLTNGNLKGTTISAIQQQDSMLAGSPDDVTPGSRVILTYTNMGDDVDAWYFMEYHRSNDLIWLCAFFFLLLILFGRKKGVNTIVSLIFTCLAIFTVFVPSILGGKNVYLWAVITCVYVTIMTLLIVNGANKKSFCAAVGCLGGLAFTGVLTLIMDSVMHLTGLVDEQAIFLTLLDGHPINLRAVIFGAILVGALGATMDVSMSLASSLQEVSEHMTANPGEGRATFVGLVKSGFNIGRDMMCTMANTLILAYIGSSLSTVLLLVANAESLLSLFNREMIVVEVLQAVVGSLGILFTIPATSLLAASIYQSKRDTRSRKQKAKDERKAEMSRKTIPPTELEDKYDGLKAVTSRIIERENTPESHGEPTENTAMETETKESK